jgi:hypothetical protein
MNNAMSEIANVGLGALNRRLCIVLSLGSLCDGTTLDHTTDAVKDEVALRACAVTMRLFNVLQRLLMRVRAAGYAWRLRAPREALRLERRRLHARRRSQTGGMGASRSSRTP